jgi:hypothetical protein
VAAVKGFFALFSLEKGRPLTFAGFQPGQSLPNLGSETVQENAHGMAPEAA